MPRENCWSLAGQGGDATPDKMQRLLERAAWEAGAVPLVLKPRGHRRPARRRVPGLA